MSSQHPGYTSSGQPYYHQYSYPIPSSPHSPIATPSFQYHTPYPMSPPSSHGLPHHSHIHLNGHQHHHHPHPTPTRMNGHGRGGYAYPHPAYSSRSHVAPSYPSYPSHPTTSKYPTYHQPYPTTTYPPQMSYPPPQHWQPHHISHPQLSSPSPKQPATSPTVDISTPSPTLIPFTEPVEAQDVAGSGEVDVTSPSVDTSRLGERTPSESPLQPPALLKSADASIRGGYTVWSRRPRRPSQAPGIIISSRARPPPDVVKNALTLPTPPASPPINVLPLPLLESANPSTELSSITSQTFSSDEPENVGNPVELDLHSKIPPIADVSLPSSSAATDTTNTPSPTTTPGSPVSTTNTSVSANITPSELPIKEPEATTAAPVPTTLIEKDQMPATPAPSSHQPAGQEVTTTPSKASPPQKKSWASLLQPSPSSAGSSKLRNSLPTSNVVGVSIPASAQASSSPTGKSVDSVKKSGLLSLLSPQAGTSTQVAAAHSYANAATTAPAPASITGLPDIRPRGLVNTGNMCFANSVLQVLVYCPPFHKLFVELGRVLGEAGGTGLLASVHDDDNSSERETPLVDATIRFLKDFGAIKINESEGGRKGKGKEKEVNDDDWDGESFIPSYVYDALKEKKRFDHMRGGQQEDAEEFLGFYLDTLEEELLSVVNAISLPSSLRPSTKVEEHEEEAPPEEDGWLEVGKRNRSVITRTIKTTESAITRIFGGKFRSTLRAPGQKDSVVIEDWRSLRLDIQPEQIHTVQDALNHISQPQSVQVTQPTRPGVTVDASQLVLIESLPPVLVLHMKRFCYDTGVGGVVKVGKHVVFGPELDIKSDVMVTKRPAVTKYKLFGVVYHHGISASGGHYTLDVLHPNRYPSSMPGSKPREAWIRVDDELLSDVRPDDVFSPSVDDTRCAYLLFYRRMGK